MPLTVATYNVYLGADIMKIFAATSTAHLRELASEVVADVAATDFGSRARGIVAALGTHGWPDLVGTQEVCTWSTDGTPWGDFTGELSAAFTEAGVDYDVVAAAPSFGGTLSTSDGREVSLSAANVTFARRDTVEVRAVRHAPYAARLAVPTAMPGVAFDIVRSWSTVAATIDGIDLVFANTHLETYDAAIRSAQLAEVITAAAGEDGPALVAGDFNESPEALRLPTGWVDAWAEVHGPAGGWTCVQVDPLLRNPESTLDHRIDYVVSRGLTVTDCLRVGHERPMPDGRWPSDHAGVVASYVTR